MNLISLKSSIVNGELDNLYYFTGDDWKLRNTYIHQIAKAKHSKLQWVDSVKEIIGGAKTSSIISGTICYVVYEDKEYLSNEKAWGSIKDLITDDMIIFVYNNIDKRSKFYKQFKDTLIEFNHLSDDLLYKYINQAISLNMYNSQRLIDVCEKDFGRVMLEVDKIKHYIPIDYNKGCEMLFDKGLIYIPPKDAVFDLVDAIIRGDTNAFYLYDQCKKVGESNLVILTNLFNKAKAVYQVQTYKGTGDLSKVTGLKSGVIWGCKKCIGYRTDRSLLYIMKLVHRIDCGIKKGTLDEELSVDYLLAQLFY